MCVVLSIPDINPHLPLLAATLREDLKQSVDGCAAQVNQYLWRQVHSKGVTRVLPSLSGKQQQQRQVRISVQKVQLLKQQQQ